MLSQCEYNNTGDLRVSQRGELLVRQIVTRLVSISLRLEIFGSYEHDQYMYLWFTTFSTRTFLVCPEERGLCSFSVRSSLLNSPNQHRTGQWPTPGEATAGS